FFCDQRDTSLRFGICDFRFRLQFQIHTSNLLESGFSVSYLTLTFAIISGSGIEVFYWYPCFIEQLGVLISWYQLGVCESHYKVLDRDEEDLLQGNQDLDEMEERRRKGIKYCTLSEEDIENISEVYVSKAFDYDRSGETPVMGGLYDPHMGPANDTLICLTCYGNFIKCQGHYGYLQLIQPVYHVGYFTIVEGILKCICKDCSRILLNNDTRTNYLKKMKGGTIKKDPNGLSFLYHNDTILYPSMALLLLTDMVDEDRELLCVAEKPEKLFISKISVPPLAVRPSLPLNLRLARFSMKKPTCLLLAWYGFWHDHAVLNSVEDAQL
ncbi:DNA-directed RNA polymerase III subunit RPC1-like, partial [Trifolium medium]|nr:DNA-directed RNA polymerase III subunit RPC1-like [Trifolium medium]